MTTLTRIRIDYRVLTTCPDNDFAGLATLEDAGAFVNRDQLRSLKDAVKRHFKHDELPDAHMATLDEPDQRSLSKGLACFGYQTQAAKANEKATAKANEKTTAKANEKATATANKNARKSAERKPKSTSLRESYQSEEGLINTASSPWNANSEEETLEPSPTPSKQRQQQRQGTPSHDSNPQDQAWEDRYMAECKEHEALKIKHRQEQVVEQAVKERDQKESKELAKQLKAETKAAQEKHRLARQVTTADRDKTSREQKVKTAGSMAAQQTQVAEAADQAVQRQLLLERLHSDVADLLRPIAVASPAPSSSTATARAGFVKEIDTLRWRFSHVLDPRMQWATSARGRFLEARKVVRKGKTAAVPYEAGGVGKEEGTGRGDWAAVARGVVDYGALALALSPTEKLEWSKTYDRWLAQQKQKKKGKLGIGGGGGADAPGVGGGSRSGNGVGNGNGNGSERWTAGTCALPLRHRQLLHVGERERKEDEQDEEDDEDEGDGDDNFDKHQHDDEDEDDNKDEHLPKHFVATFSPPAIKHDDDDDEIEQPLIRAPSASSPAEFYTNCYLPVQDRLRQHMPDIPAPAPAPATAAAMK
ncbi:hypothetical protein BST61_g11476 [Cercospora zeina]